MSVAGVVVFVLASSGTPAWSLRGDLLAVASLLVWTAYFLVSKRVRQRVGTVEQELRDAEEALKRFYQANRSWQQSPQLTFEEGELRRQVDLRQELYRSLRREYETARIEEVNDTPVITVIDAAVVPQRKSGPSRRLWALAAFVLSGVLAVTWAFSAQFLERARREQDGPYRDLVTTAEGFWNVVWPFGTKSKKAQRDS